MSIELIKTQIASFLDSTEPEVMAIRGSWGVGKTFTWNQVLLDSKEHEKLKWGKYSYITLFGVNSLDTLKNAIFENLIDKKLIGTEPTVSSFKDNAVSMSASLGRRGLKQLKNLPFIKQGNSMIDSLSYMYVSESLICIDDLERKGSALDPKDVLGIVSQLKEQKKCKIVILLNDSDIKKIPNYNEFKEKVIDKELNFNPTPTECVKLIVSDNHPLYAEFKGCVESLKLTNMRVLKKTFGFINQCSEYCEAFESEVVSQVCQSLTLFVSSYYKSSSDNHIPSIEFLLNKSLYVSNRNEDCEEEKKWRLTLQEYGFYYLDELDRVLIEVVQSGFVNEQAFLVAANLVNEKHVKGKQEHNFHEAWRAFHNSFDNDDEAFRDILYSTASNALSTMSPTNLSSTVCLLRDINEPKLATSLIETFIKMRKDDREVFNLGSSNPFGDKIDDEVTQLFEEALVENEELESIKDLLKRVSTNQSWGNEDIERLVKVSEDEYFDLFKAENGEHLSKIVAFSLKHGAVENAKKALIRIGNESPLNQRRVEKFGIDVKNEHF